MKANTRIGFGPRKGKKGFTLIELLIVMVILAILAGVVVMAVGGVFGTSRERAYTVTKDEMKNAVADYASRNNGDLPYTSTINTTIDGETRYIINISALMTSQSGILGDVPDSAANLSGNDNCFGGIATCHDDAHYVWATDQYGNIYSACDDANGGSTTCDANDADGFQTVYP
jgi:prepilin-type N-terminal cleavage/methylation domain-containing protein